VAETKRDDTTDEGARGTRLLSAANLIDSVARTLNTRTTSCTCGRQLADDLLQFTAHEQLLAASARLKRWADALDHPENYDQRGVHLDDRDRIYELKNTKRREKPHGH
jgi:hypothetical protein